MVAVVGIIHSAVGIRVVDVRMAQFQPGLPCVRAVLGALKCNGLLNAV